MLVSLHVKNFAIIDEVEVNFKNHLNILTGETGAGKSIIIGSINVALGGKVSKDIIREGAEYALVELVFEASEQTAVDLFHEMDLPIEDGQIIIQRKIMQNRNVCKVNGETVTSSCLNQIAELLIDIHGQHEHQSLLHKHKHLEILDRFAKHQVEGIKNEVLEAFVEYTRLKKELASADIDEDKRLREISLLQYEIDEIKKANLKEGEEEELTSTFKKLSNAKNIVTGLQTVHDFTGNSMNESASELIGRSVKQLVKLVDYDDALNDYYNQLCDIENLLSDFNRNVSSYLSEIDSFEEDFDEVSKRLDLIHYLMAKYGDSVEEINEYCNKNEEKLKKYLDYDAYLLKLKNDFDKAENRMESCATKLSCVRKKEAELLNNKIEEALISLNFLDVRFRIEFSRTSNYTKEGYDEVEFMIATNPGEAIKPLSKVASGGELSRVMLGIKSILADKDEIETLIFDEIDTGISGRTAQKVSERLSMISKNHQIICITHLPQIAAMSDTHYVIEKATDGVKTKTNIFELTEEQSIQEIARILGGAVITDRVIDSAKEMKELANNTKKY